MSKNDYGVTDAELANYRVAIAFGVEPAAYSQLSADQRLRLAGVFSPRLRKIAALAPQCDDPPTSQESVKK